MSYGWPNPKWNFSATTDPGSANDRTQQYEIGSQWINVTLDTCWECTDNSSGAAVWKQTAGAGTGTVTSVGLSLPAEFVVSGSPVTTSGTLTGTWATEAANLVFAGPSSGAAAIPTFRALAVSDIPADVVHVHIMGEVGNVGDGAATIWYLAQEAQDLEVAAYVNGSRNVSFTQSGDTITFSAAPGVGDAVVFDYIPVLA